MHKEEFRKKKREIKIIEEKEETQDIERDAHEG